MDLFANVNWFDFVVLFAVFMFAFNAINLWAMVALANGMAASGKSVKFSYTLQLYAICICSVIIYFHLFIPSPH